MTLSVLLFAHTRERVGRSHLTLELPSGSRVSDAVAALRRAHPALEPLWPHLAIALNGEITRLDAPLPDGAELALLPPVSGG